MKRLPHSAWVMIERVAGQGLGLAFFAVQAPLLGPHAFGLMALMMVATGFWDGVLCATATDALVAVPRLNRAHTGSVVPFLLGCAALAVLGIWALAGPLAHAAGLPEIAHLLPAMAGLPVLQGMAVAPLALLQRNYGFRGIALCTILSQLCGGGAGVALAYAGAGTGALITQALVQKSVALAALLSLCPSALAFRFRRAEAAELAHFAVPNGLSRIMAWSSGQVPRLVLGMALGADALGMFTLATRLSDVVTQAALLPVLVVARVALRGLPAGSAALRRRVAASARDVALVTMPLCFGGMAVLPWVIRLWLDQRWQAGLPVCAVMLMLPVPFCTIYVSATALLALNRQRAEALLCAGQSLAIIAAVWLAAPLGVTAVAWALLGLGCAMVLPVLAMLRHVCGLRVRDVLLPQVLPLLAAAGMAVAVRACLPLLAGFLPPLPALVAGIALGAAMYGVAVAGHVARLAGGRMLAEAQAGGGADA